MAPRLESEVDWQLQYDGIKQRGAHLLQTGQWSDCAFLVGPAGPDQVEFKAHKLILAVASPVFEAMFYGPIAEANNPISIPDMSPDTFKKLLLNVYTDNIELNDFSSAVQLYYGAQKYMLPHLMKGSARHLSRNKSLQTVGRTYEFAKLVGEKELMTDCLQMMVNQTKAVLQDSAFEEMEVDTVLKIFTMNEMQIDSELDLFAAAERYAKALDRRSEDGASSEDICNMDEESEVENDEYEDVEDSGAEDNKQAPTEDEAKKKTDQVTDGLACHRCRKIYNKRRGRIVKVKDNKRASIRELLHQIRFLALTAQQFAEYETLSSLLTKSEILAIIMNIASSNTNVPMPSGFSTCKQKRCRPFSLFFS